MNLPLYCSTVLLLFVSILVQSPSDAAAAAWQSSISNHHNNWLTHLPKNGHGRVSVRLQQYENDDYSEGSTLKGRRIRPKRLSSRTAAAEKKQEQQRAESRQRSALKDPTLLSNVDFERFQLHSQLARALPFEKMTAIQSRTFTPILEGWNVVGRARTGTGKTLAYLVPILQRLLEGESTAYQPGRNIYALIVAPTRELALQISQQAEALLQYAPDYLTVQTMYGGTKMARDAYLLNRRLPALLVATPGRLQDHLKTTKLSGSKAFADIMRETSVVVLDETDRLLEMGFRKDIYSILSYCARPEKRQLLLFSATISPSKTVEKIMGKQPFEFVDCCLLDADEPQSIANTKKQQQQQRRDTNLRVKQSYIVLPAMSMYLSALVDLLQQQYEIENCSPKIVVFLPTARAVSFLTQFLQHVLPPSLSIFELHSRKSQSARSKASAEFAKCKQGMLLTTNVSARGIDYPDVTLVIQYGAPDSRENYIHRLGRTGRAGRPGKGLVVLMPFETTFLDRQKNQGLVLDQEFSALVSKRSLLSDQLEATRRRIASGDYKLTASAQGAYRAFLAYCVEHKDQWGLTPKDIVQHANEFAQCTGLVKIPPVSEKNAAKLGLFGVAGLVVGDD